MGIKRNRKPKGMSDESNEKSRAKKNTSSGKSDSKANENQNILKWIGKIELAILKGFSKLRNNQELDNSRLITAVKSTIGIEVRNEWKRINDLDKVYKNEIIQLNNNFKSEKDNLQHIIAKQEKQIEKLDQDQQKQSDIIETADQQKNKAKEENEKLKVKIGELRSIESQQKEKNNIVLKNLFDDEESKRLIQKIPPENLNAVYSVLVILESNLFILKTISNHANANQVIDPKRERITLQIISVYLMDAVNDERLDDDFVNIIIEFVNKKSSTYNIIKPTKIFDAKMHKTISDDEVSPMNIDKHYSLPIILKDAPADAVKITKGLVKPR